MKVLMSALADGAGEPGQVLDDALTVACGSGAVRLIRVQREGRAAQPAAEMLKGLPISRHTMLPSSSEPPRGER